MKLLKPIYLYLLCAIALGCTVVFFFFYKTPRPQIYDCFLFFNELELLEVRLDEMYPYVDKFVLVEASETFRGKPKSLIFAENKDNFARFADKIIYVPLTEHLETDNPWERERYQRQQVFRGLTGCRDRDLIFLSDIDEIVRGSAIPQIACAIAAKKAQAVVCSQKMYFGCLNRFLGQWQGTVCTSYRDAKSMGVKKMRRLRHMRPGLLRKAGIAKAYLIDNAGWHFTSMGGLERYITKIESYSHVETDSPSLKTDECRTQMISACALHEIDASFPQFIRDHRLHFEEIGFLEIR